MLLLWTNMLNVATTAAHFDTIAFIKDLIEDTAAQNNPEPNLVITEIMFNPASSENDWEWIELYNAGNTTVDLSGFVIDDKNGTAHPAANVATGSLAPSEIAVLFNADDISAEDFAMAWGDDIYLVAVTNWSAMGLNNSTDTIGLWQNYEDYDGDHETHAKVLISTSYPDIDNNAGSVFLENLEDQNNYKLSEPGLKDALGGTAFSSLALAGNSGMDVGSPGSSATISTNNPEITGFVLIDAKTSDELMPITANAEINLSELPTENFSIRAVASEFTESVFLAIEGERSFSRTENVPHMRFLEILPANIKEDASRREAIRLGQLLFRRIV